MRFAVLSGSPSGFQDARGTRALVVWVLTAPIVLALLNVQYRFGLNVRPDLVDWHQWSRILLNGLVFTDQVSAVLGAIVIYECRAVERMLGTRQYLEVVLQLALASAAAIPLALGLLDHLGYPIESQPGPTAVIAGLLVLYFAMVPPLFRIDLVGIGSFTDRVILLIMAHQLVITTWGVVVKALVGFTVGRALFVLKHAK